MNKYQLVKTKALPRFNVDDLKAHLALHYESLVSEVLQVRSYV